eukprot:c13043_g2_i4.p1 GENE.c13043_g2_i4~~c13043_g2_i4.p1  ORF type:complete len:703 (+),score=169.05 c13043_g2_i4:172-2109(+)
MTACTHKFCTNCLVQFITQHKSGVLACAVCKAAMCDQDVVTLVGQEQASLIRGQQNTETNNAVMFAVLGAADEATFRRIAGARHFRLCTACSSPIEKNGGCDNMQCRCGHRFRWSQAPTIVPCNQVHFRARGKWHTKYWGYTCPGCMWSARVKLVCWRSALVIGVVPTIIVGAVGVPLLFALFLAVKPLSRLIRLCFNTTKTQITQMSQMLEYRFYPSRFPYGPETTKHSSIISKSLRSIADRSINQLRVQGMDRIGRGRVIHSFRQFADPLMCTISFNASRTRLACRLIAHCLEASLFTPSFDPRVLLFTNFVTNHSNNNTDKSPSTVQPQQDHKQASNTNNNSSMKRSFISSLQSMSSRHHNNHNTNQNKPANQIAQMTKYLSDPALHSAPLLSEEMERCLDDLLRLPDVLEFVLGGRFLRLDASDIRNQCVMEVLGYGGVGGGGAASSSGHVILGEELAAVMLEGSGLPMFEAPITFPRSQMLVRLIDFENGPRCTRIQTNNITNLFVFVLPDFDSSCDVEKAQALWTAQVETIERSVSWPAFDDTRHFVILWDVGVGPLSSQTTNKGEFDPKMFQAVFPEAKACATLEEGLNHMSQILYRNLPSNPQVFHYTSNITPEYFWESVCDLLLWRPFRCGSVGLI